MIRRKEEDKKHPKSFNIFHILQSEFKKILSSEKILSLHVQ